MNKEERIYYKMRLIREAENAIIREYPSNQIKTPCHLAIGAEAIAVAVLERFNKARIFASYRNHHWYLAAGGSLDNFFLELYGKQNPIADGKAGSMHLSCPEQGLMLTSAVVASQIGPAVGHAFAMKYKGDDTLTICVLGDGATEEGVFYECLNLAKLYQLKILFVVEDNGLAIHQHKSKRQKFDLKGIADAYEIQFEQASSLSTRAIVDCINRFTEYPAIASFVYIRIMEHVGIRTDYCDGYRSAPPPYFDPLYDKKNPEIDALIQKEIALAIEKAKAAPLAPVESLLDHVFHR